MDGGEGLKATFVVPWYGKDIPGGAEAEARRTAQNLAAAGVEVGVLTTCLAGLGSDWDHDALPPGIGREDGVAVRRFPTARRDAARFNSLNARIMAGQELGRTEERDFFANMIHSPALMEHLAAHPEEGPFFFIPYLFTTSVWGPLVHPSKSIITPCLHDEGYARLDSVRRAIETARAVCFHVPAEMRLGERLYDLGRTEPLIVGEGIDTGWQGDGARFRAKYGVEGPFALYAGRKDAGKNTPLLVQYFLRYLAERGGAGGLRLYLIGNLPAPIPPGGRDAVIDLGFVPVQDKYDAYAAADVFIQPSVMESFSIVIMEAWLAGAPVMVHGACAVTREHVEVSGGGLHFADYPHFAEGLDLILSRPELAAAMAEAGRRYVLERFAWPAVTERFLELIRRVSAEPPARPGRWKGPDEAAGGGGTRPKASAGGGRPAVHQMLPDFAFGDAIGGDALAIQKALRRAGFASDIFAQNLDRRLAGRARPVGDYAAEAGPDDALIFHFSIGHPLADRLTSMPGRKVLRYHNITPAEYLAACNPESAQRSILGREQLARLAPAVELGLGVSPYNCEELAAAGCPDTAMVPILLDLDVLGTPPDPAILTRFGDGRPQVLHVGRLAPNKAIEDLIKTHRWLAKLLPGARLLLVGSDAGWRPYSEGLRNLVRDLEVPGVHFSGHVSFPGLMAYYRAAGAYLCLSEHEGFCVPLVEAMHFALPIVAYASTGVPGTLGDGGVLLPEKDPVVAAETLAMALTDRQLNAALKRAAAARLERFRPERVAAELIAALGERLGLEPPA